MTKTARETLAATTAVPATALLAWGAMNTPTHDGAPRVTPITSITPTEAAPR